MSWAKYRDVKQLRLPFSPQRSSSSMSFKCLASGLRTATPQNAVSTVARLCCPSNRNRQAPRSQSDQHVDIGDDIDCELCSRAFPFAWRQGESKPAVYKMPLYMSYDVSCVLPDSMGAHVAPTAPDDIAEGHEEDEDEPPALQRLGRGPRGQRSRYLPSWKRAPSKNVTSRALRSTQYRTKDASAAGASRDR